MTRMQGDLGTTIRFIHEANVRPYTPEEHGRFTPRKFNIQRSLAGQNHREITIENDIFIKYRNL